ncbi:cupin domain-containing protein [Streptomyces noursei]|uniref:cupin domain-containing protein n=1 Tax=Streptomyces noursei TaxID=1971 RepID=UPI0023DB64CC|nr:cupin domain-containing protein [Streptomyces noursei]
MMIDRRALIRNAGAAAGALGVTALVPSVAAAAAPGAGPGDTHPHCPGDHTHPTGPVDPTDPTSGVTRTVLQRHPSPVEGWETVQTLVQIPTGKESGRHSHPGVEVGYLVRGDVLMVFDDGQVLRLRTGDPFFIPSGAIHNARNVGRETTMMLSTYVVDETKPLVTTYGNGPAKSRP